jgi:hypothetical protein
MAKKLTKHQLELEEKKLDLLERKALLKEAKEKLVIERTYMELYKAGEIRAALTVPYLMNNGVETTKEYGFSEEEFLLLIKKYYNILKNI